MARSSLCIKSLAVVALLATLAGTALPLWGQPQDRNQPRPEDPKTDLGPTTPTVLTANADWNTCASKCAKLNVNSSTTSNVNASVGITKNGTTVIMTCITRFANWN